MSKNSIRLCLQAWNGWTEHRELTGNNIAPLLLRRRVSPLGQNALKAAWNIPTSENARYIFSSRHGEFGRTLSILENYIDEKTVSPADFSLSVHHALIGLLSIAQQNHQGHIALASGNETLCLALIEAYALLKERPDENVMIVHCDEPLGGAFSHFNDEAEIPIVLVLLLSAKTGTEYSLSWSSETDGEAEMSCHALEVLKFLDSNANTLTTFGQRKNWKWDRHV